MTSWVAVSGATPVAADAVEWSPGLGQICVGSNLDDGISMVISTSSTGGEEPIIPTGTYTSPTPTLGLTVPAGYLALSQGFYLVGFQFVDNCDDLEPVADFTPCFTVPTPDVDNPWVLPLGDDNLLFFFLSPDAGDEESPEWAGDRTFDIQVSQDTGAGCDETPDVVEPDLGEVLDLVDIYFENTRRNHSIDLDHYLEREMAREAAALPNTR